MHVVHCFKPYQDISDLIGPSSVYGGSILYSNKALLGSNHLVEV